MGTSNQTEQKMIRALLLAACFLGVCCLSHVEEMKSQERLFLNSLGLSARPPAAASGSSSSQARRRVPSALWRMFRRSENMPVQESDPCMVSEYGVRGNIIRYVQDQGKEGCPTLILIGLRNVLGLPPLISTF